MPELKKNVIRNVPARVVKFLKKKLSHSGAQPIGTYYSGKDSDRHGYSPRLTTLYL